MANSINENDNKIQKQEELINFSFKNDLEPNNINSLTSSKEEKLMEQNIYSKNDKNIHKSGHFGSNNLTQTKNYIKEFQNPNNNYLIKTLFSNSNQLSNNDNDNSSNCNKENLDINNYNDKIEKIQTITLPNKKGISQKIFQKKLLNKKCLAKINNKTNNSKQKIKNNIILKKKIIKKNRNKLFYSSNTNPVFKNRYLESSNICKSNNKYTRNKNNRLLNDNSLINKSFDFIEKRKTDKLNNKINKKLSLFSEYNKRLEKKIKNLNKEMSSFEMNKSNTNNNNERNNKLITVSPYEKKSINFYSDNKNNLLKRKANISDNKKNKTISNKKHIQNQIKSNSFINEFNIGGSHKKDNKNIKISPNIVNEKNFKRRRVKTNNFFECIHIKLI